MTLQIKKATKEAAKLRMALIGASGSGKTYTALSIAENLGSNILFVDTEHGSASKYADLFSFDVVELSDFPPEKFIESIRLAEANNYDVVIIDSLSHEWNGKGGILELHKAEEKITRNSFTAWAKVTPRHNALIEAIVQSGIHVITTMRAKTDYSMSKDERGKTQVENVGLAPIQREGMEYEFDVVGHLDHENNFIVQKSRCPTLNEKVFNKAGLAVAEILKVWLSGVPKTRVLPPEQKLEIVKPTAENQPAADAPKPDYSQEWNEKMNNPTARTSIEKTFASFAEKGKWLFELGSVSRTNVGYAVLELVFGKQAVSEVTKKDGVVQCDCVHYADGISDRFDFQCEHIEAVKCFAANQQKQAA